MRIAIVWVAVVCLCGYFEVQRFLAVCATPAGPLGWFLDWDPETTLPFIVLAILPVLCLISGRRPNELVTPTFEHPSLMFRAFGCVTVLVLSLSASAFVGFQTVSVSDGVRHTEVAFVDLPPAYHDEYSYLLQAQTFAAGRLSWPPAPIRPDLFHQYHVVNERRTASRYFPLTGAWTAMFLSTGRPVIGHWVAGAFAAMFFFLSATKVLRTKAAFIAGVLIAVSPGLAVFSNLLLAHHPTMFALSLFLWAMLNLLMSASLSWALLAGTGLSLAMLGRPMTAAAFGLPWGIVFAWRWFCAPNDAWAAKRHRLVIAVAGPLIVGFGVLGILNQDVTGSITRSAYQEYTDTYTPRHAFGFGNGVRGDAMQTPKVLTKYDQWAVNLTWPVAMKNVGHRCLASGQWTLGIIPIVFGLLLIVMRMAMSVDECDAETLGLRLIAASVVTLHLAHVSYWFDGIMHWHYVFETAPLLLILVAGGLAAAYKSLETFMPPSSRVVWMGGLLMAALLPGWFSAELFWGTSKIAAATSELAWSRRQFALFDGLVASELVTKPALILVDESSADPQLSYIVNDPEYASDVLVARLPMTLLETADLQDAFPERHFYRFDPGTFFITPISTKQQEENGLRTD